MAWLLSTTRVQIALGDADVTWCAIVSGPSLLARHGHGQPSPSSGQAKAAYLSTTAALALKSIAAAAAFGLCISLVLPGGAW